MVGFGPYRRPFRWRSSPRAENEQLPFGCFLMVIVPVLFVASTYSAWWELRYFVQGRTAKGTVVDVHDVTTRRRFGTASVQQAVRYSFVDDANQQMRNETDRVSKSWHLQPQQAIDIQYIASLDKRSRLAGNRNYFSVFFFVVCTTATVVYSIKLYREARHAVEESERFERRRADS